LIPERYWSDLKKKHIKEGSQLYENIVQLKFEASGWHNLPTIWCVPSRSKSQTIHSQASVRVFHHSLNLFLSQSQARANLHPAAQVPILLKNQVIDFSNPSICHACSLFYYTSCGRAFIGNRIHFL
jgi:hypothetical protein